MSDLLDLQAIDSEVEAIDRRIQLGEEQAAFETAVGAVRQLESVIAHVGAEDQALAGDIAKVEAEVEPLDRRIEAFEKDLAGFHSSKELDVITAEIAELKRRRGRIEESELELMERREALAVRRSRLETELEAARSDATAKAKLAASAGEALGVSRSDLIGRRAEIVSLLDPELIRSYEAIRTRSDGIAAAKLVAGVCSGCHLRPSAIELDQIRKASPDEIVTCPECGRILVR